MTTATASTDDVLRIAAARLRAALQAEDHHLPASINLLDAILRAWPGVGTVAGRPSPELADDIAELLRSIHLPVAEATQHAAVPTIRILAGLGSAAGLLTANDDDFDHARIAYVGLLLSDLRSCVCLSIIADHGDPIGVTSPAHASPTPPQPPLMATNNATFH